MPNGTDVKIFTQQETTLRELKAEKDIGIKVDKLADIVFYDIAHRQQAPAKLKKTTWAIICGVILVMTFIFNLPFVKCLLGG